MPPASLGFVFQIWMEYLDWLGKEGNVHIILDFDDERLLFGLFDFPSFLFCFVLFCFVLFCFVLFSFLLLSYLLFSSLCSTESSWSSNPFFCFKRLVYSCIFLDDPSHSANDHDTLIDFGIYQKSRR